MKRLYKDNLISNRELPVSVDIANDVTFLHGALRAAQNSRALVRDKIINDIIEVLECEADEIEFLFKHEPQNDQEIFDFPDDERLRFVMRNNFLDAAE